MKINNWVLKAGVPLDCFHLCKRFITTNTEDRESKEKKTTHIQNERKKKL